MAKRILVVAATAREHRELPKIAARLGYELIFEDWDWSYFDAPQTRDYGDKPLKILPRIESIRKEYEGKIDGITSAVGYPGMSVVAILAKQLGLPGPSPDAIMRCEHKYYSRLAQEKYVPEATSHFTALNVGDQPPKFGYPRFLKPIKSFMSMNAQRVESPEQVVECLQSGTLPDSFVEPFDEMVAAHTTMERTARGFLLEELLQGTQVSLEGFVHNRQPEVMGIVDAVMFPGTISFQRWVYPSRLPADVQQVMIDTAIKFFRGIEYDDAMFNMELMYNPQTGKVHIIEVNPKIASQFPDLFERVDGISSYQPMLQIAAGEAPQFTHRKGQFKVAASCVLRTFEDQFVLWAPSLENISQVNETYPDARVQIMAKAGHKLSEQAQDAQSFRYGLINLGATSEEDLERRFAVCRNILNFDFRPVAEFKQAVE